MALPVQHRVDLELETQEERETEHTVAPGRANEGSAIDPPAANENMYSRSENPPKHVHVAWEWKRKWEWEWDMGWSLMRFLGAGLKVETQARRHAGRLMYVEM